MAPPLAAARVLPFLAAALLAWGAREACTMRMPWPAPAGRGEDWFSADPDGLYHARRVLRALEEGGMPAARDPLLASPGGAPVPWPPYYDLALAAALRPALPAAAAARPRYVEHAVASAPLLLGILTSLLAAAGGLLLAGRGGAWVAGALHALTYGSIHYSAPGVGDHHAWVSLLAGAMLLLAALALRRPQARRRALAAGLAAGVLAGVLLGSWVASLLYVLEVQLVLGVLALRHGRRPLPALAPFGLAFHGAALATVMPAILASPWRLERPWDVVNLSWTHAAELALGLLVLLPLARLRGERARRRWPWLAGGGLALFAAGLFLLDAGPAAGIREGFAWVSRADRFMAGIAESEPLLGADRTGAGGLWTWLGFGVVLAPLAWAWGFAAMWRRGRLEWLPWLVAVPLLLVQALAQRRFADPLALPLAVALAGGLLPPLRAWADRRGGRAVPAVTALVVAAPLLLQAPALERCRQRLAGRDEMASSVSVWRQGAWRLLAERLADEGGGGAVLAPWDLGHMVEWVAGRPVVATNFGSYVDEQGFRDAAAFFLAADEDEAHELLRRHGVTQVMVPSSLAAGLPGLRRAAGEQVQLGRSWDGTLAARLCPVGDPLRAPAAAPGWLRLVHVSAFVEPVAPRPLAGRGQVPLGWLWEVVAGARLVARGAPGDRLEVEVELGLPGGRRYLWHSAAAAGPGGVAELRVPYSTDAPGREAEVRRATWRLGERSGRLQVPEEAVRTGAEIALSGGL